MDINNTTKNRQTTLKGVRSEECIVYMKNLMHTLYTCIEGSIYLSGLLYDQRITTDLQKKKYTERSKMIFNGSNTKCTWRKYVYLTLKS